MTLRSALSSHVLAAALVATAISAIPATQHDRCSAFMAANPDLVCLPLVVAKAVDIKLATAVKRYGWTLGCGTGAGLLVDVNWKSQGAPVPLFCGGVFGWRMK